MLKSVPSADAAYVTFVNHSDKTAEVIWYDFNGEMLRYGMVAPAGQFHVNTYSQHPWKCFDNATGLELNLNGQPVYYPISVREIHQRLQLVQVALRSVACRRSEVIISTPQATLYSLCQQLIMKYINKLNDLQDLEIPELVKNDLRRLFASREAYRTQVADMAWPPGQFAP